MPQHWVGRSGSSTGRVLVALIALVLAAGHVQLETAYATTPVAGSAAEAALLQLAQQHGHPAAAARATRFAGNQRWETGTLVIPAAGGSGEHAGHDEPLVFLYVGHRNGSGWSVALEGSSDFALLAEQGYAAMSGTASAELLATTAVSGTSGGSASLSLPWAAGQTWRMTGGPHSDGSGYRLSALDFAGPKPDRPVKVRAARAGIVVRPCANMIQVRHAGGWTTSYYHLRGIGVRAGQSVARGAFLGWTSTAAGCGGMATGPHVHFSLLRYGKYVSIHGHVIGGWTVREGSSPYEGCMVRGDERRCAPRARIYNQGSIGDK